MRFIKASSRAPVGIRFKPIYSLYECGGGGGFILYLQHRPVLGTGAAYVRFVQSIVYNMRVRYFNARGQVTFRAWVLLPKTTSAAAAAAEIGIARVYTISSYHLGFRSRTSSWFLAVEWCWNGWASENRKKKQKNLTRVIFRPFRNRKNGEWERESVPPKRIYRMSRGAVDFFTVIFQLHDDTPAVMWNIPLAARLSSWLQKIYSCIFICSYI